MTHQPERVGKYEVLGLLGHGAIGVVYKARDPLMNRTIALKKFARAETGGDAHVEEMKVRFLQEARAAGKLKHGNIVTIYDVDVDLADGLPFMAMEFAEGGSLASWIRTHGAMPLPRAVDLIQQVALGLAYGHERGVVHRDIKPANILLDADGRALIADFGCAHVQDSELTKTGEALGTPFYMSPEQVKAEPIDGRSDLFSLGVVLYLLVTGRRPFKGDSISVVVYHIVHEPPDPLPAQLSHADLLEPILAKLLAKQREDRFASGKELAAALETLRSSIGDTERDATLSQTMDVESEPAGADASPPRVPTAAAVPHVPPTPLPEPALTSQSPGASVERTVSRPPRKASPRWISGLVSLFRSLLGITVICLVGGFLMNWAYPGSMDRIWGAARKAVPPSLSRWWSGASSKPMIFQRADVEAKPGNEGSPAGRVDRPAAKVPASSSEVVRVAEDASALARKGRFQDALQKLDLADSGLKMLAGPAGAAPRTDLQGARTAVSRARTQVAKALEAWAKPILDQATSAVGTAGQDREAVVNAYAGAYPVILLSAHLPGDLRKKADTLGATCRNRLSDEDWARAKALGKARAAG